jgi:hypothetical protein
MTQYTFYLRRLVLFLIWIKWVNLFSISSNESVANWRIIIVFLYFNFQLKSLPRRWSPVVSVLWSKTLNLKRRKTKNRQKIWISFDANLPSAAKMPKTKRRNKMSNHRKRRTTLSRRKRPTTSNRRVRRSCLRNQVSQFWFLN